MNEETIEKLKKNPHYNKKKDKKHFNLIPMHNNDIEVHSPLEKKKRVYKKKDVV